MKALISFVLLLFYSNISFCQRTNMIMLQNNDSIISRIIGINNMLPSKDKSKFLSTSSRCIEVKQYEIPYASTHSAPFDFKYIDSLEFTNEISYAIYNQNDAGEINLVCIFDPRGDDIYFVTQTEAQTIRNIYRLFEPKELRVIHLVGVWGFSVIYKDKIWVVDDSGKTDLNTYLKSRPSRKL